MGQTRTAKKKRREWNLKRKGGGEWNLRRGGGGEWSLRRRGGGEWNLRRRGTRGMELAYLLLGLTGTAAEQVPAQLVGKEEAEVSRHLACKGGR